MEKPITLLIFYTTVSTKYAPSYVGSFNASEGGETEQHKKEHSSLLDSEYSVKY